MSGGFKVGTNLHTFYYSDGDNFNEVVARMIKYIYTHYPNYTFFVRRRQPYLDFDGIYLLNAILLYLIMLKLINLT